MGIVYGTPTYMAPEQFEGADAVTPISDQYGFGCCFYEALASEQLFLPDATSGLEHVLQMQDLHPED